ncbi:iron dicitrate ABC transporter ATP-binding protein [Burkholderia mayonis]|uniref:Iron dicitrate ABC transporter ATP-binding protein n=1 Tax=Burkholderia mayonis TaxID=1385591 RepID=A0A1B4FJ80_9BURK|nr:ABC transporter ATP-binding protein [Burkholderia mayonis]AOJ03727.1 iron dicitrate ABC transporter ATP-binding protein [Burkholderia mayonis]KVE46895.1 iron dicitrate ABC transporter ATP-binding protein [Burkholderia mayonis]
MTLVARDLSLGYGPRRIVDTLSLSIEPGRITVLLGPNGSGKSTLLRALAGLLAPRGGDALLDDVPLGQWPRRKLARRIAFLAQTQDIPAGLTVQELVRHGRFAHRTWLRGETDDDRGAVEWALTTTGLLPMRDRPLVALSGGERQRVGIAMALAQRADILLLDEPTTYLDLGHQLDVMQTLRRLNEEFGLTLVMSLHDLNQAMRFADRAIVMRGGRLVADGAPVDVLTPAFVADVFHVRSERLHGASDGVPVCHSLGYAGPGGERSDARQDVGDAVSAIEEAGDD